jgi:rare lipoprotein A
MNKFLSSMTSVCFGAGLLLQGCVTVSENPSVEDGGNPAVTTGANTSGAYYGTGPNNSRPAPQTRPVDLTDVTGAKLTSEKYSVRGNKDYVVLGQKYKVWRDVDSYYEEGTASWYGPGFHGQNTSNGEPYNMNGYTAAHKNLPLPSFLKVTNLENGKAVIVRVNDRGPFHGNRILDLSKGAASKIGVIGPGTARVSVELIKTVPNDEQTSMNLLNGYKPYIQIFSTMDYNKAENIKNSLAKETGKPVFIQNYQQAYRIKVGPLKQEEAASTLSKIKQCGYSGAFFTAD